MIEFVFLDLDDTILDFLKAESVALSKTLTHLGIDPTEQTVARYSTINAAQWRLLEQGVLTREEVKVRRFRLLFEELGVAADAEHARVYYEAQLGIGHFFMPGALELLEALHGRYQLYIMSNGTTAVQNGRIASAGIAPYFKEIFLSEQMGAVKPQREFFDACFARIPGFDRSRAIIVGDSLSSDILGGINAGIRTCWFNPRGHAENPAIRPDLVLDRLTDLPALLENL